MNRDLALKYQAFVDGELSESEASQVARTIEGDPEAQALVAELRGTKALLTANEAEVKLPESREFFWSKIQREIERLEAEPAAARIEGGWWAGWRRFLSPLAGVAVIAFLAVTAMRMYVNNTTPADYLAEIENLSDESTSYSFRSGNMFVVWVQDTSVGGNDSQAEFIDYDDAIAQ